MNKSFIMFHPPYGWINDPNGLIYFKSKYRIFFQYNPVGLKWDTMNWGYATSTDLIHFEYKDIVLSPSIKEDKDGCFSGTSFVHNNKLYLIYTGIEYIDKSKGIFKTNQIITFTNGSFNDFNKHKKVILREYPNNDIEPRDPFILFKENNDSQFIFILGSSNNNKGSILYYSLTFNNKEEIEVKFIKEEIISNLGRRVECPSLFFNNRFLLSSSLDISIDNQLTSASVLYDKKNNIIKTLDLENDIYASLPFFNKNNELTYFSFLRIIKPFKNKFTNTLSIPINLSLDKNEEISYKINSNIFKLNNKIIKNFSKINFSKFPYLILIKDFNKFTLGTLVVEKSEDKLKFIDNLVDEKEVQVNKEFRGCYILTTPLSYVLVDINGHFTYTKVHRFKTYEKLLISSNTNTIVKRLLP